MQGFKSFSNKFIVKEFCLLHGDFVHHDIVKSPFNFRDLRGPFKRLARWNTHCHHGLDFDSGNTSVYKLIQSTLEHVEGKTVIVKGVEKKEWVKKLYENYCPVYCENIEDWNPFNYNFKSNKDIAEICPFHRQVVSSSCHCALSQAKELSEIFYKH